jgi:uncharacterized protein involved in outer membrane biogenesis
MNGWATIGWHKRWVRRTALAGLAVLVLWALAWLTVPPLLKWQAQARLGQALGRTVSIGAVDFRPWSLDLELHDLAIAAAPSAAASEPQLRLARLHVNASAASLLRRAPVLEALELDGLRLRLTHTAPGHYDIDDLIARFASPPDAPADAAEPARFALYNVQLRDAELRFDDRPAGRVHTLDGATLTLPFVSNLPSQIDVTVEPRLAFRLNGTAFDSGAHATPFAQSRSGELEIAFTDLDLGPYLGYLPAALPVRLQRGAVSAALRVRFALPEGAAPSVVLQGRAGAKDVVLADADAAPLVGWRRLELGLREVQPFARTLAFDGLRVEGLALQVARAADGALNLARLGAAAAPPAAASAPSTAASAPPAAPAAAAWAVSLATLDIADATVRWNDATTRPAAALQLDGLALHAQKIAWPMREAVPLKLEATLRPQGEGAAAAGRLVVDGTAGERAAALALQLDGLSLPALAPYLAQTLVPAVEGRLSASAKLAWAGDAQAPQLALTQGAATLEDLRLVEARGARPVVALRQLVIDGLALDAIARRVAIGKVVLAQPTLSIARDAQGRWNAARWAAAPAAPSAAAVPAAAVPAAGASAAVPWQVQLQEFALDGGRLEFSDAAAGHAAESPVKAEVGAVRVRLQDVAWPAARGTPPARLQLGLRVGGAAAVRDVPNVPGTIEWNGRFAPDPLAASGTLRIERFPVHVFEPYFGEAVNLSLLRAEAGWKGEVALQSTPAGWSVKAGGDARLTDVRVHTRPERATPAGFAATDELLSWQTFSIDGLRVEMKPGAKPQVEVRQATLSDFYSRLVITEQGRFNLRDVAAGPSAAASAPPAAASAAAAASAPADAARQGLPIELAVGGLRLDKGRVDFTDRFVRPNYSAALSELSGRLGAFRTGTRDMATLELQGRAAGTALLDIRGALNPTAQPLALDIQAKATDLELAPLSPYAGKYAGYAIERGKLSMDVAYRIDPDGKLEARNQVVLNQLTFGEKVESPDATKLPVLLAVALLKDRNGVIDINLPISGSINDPQFSVFGLVLKVIGNLLVKAITAPFALLAGGGGEDLSLVEFRPGTAIVAERSGATLDKVAKALGERPALKMTVTGAADPLGEREAFQRAALEARLLAEHRRELLREGRPQAEVDAIASLGGDTRAKVLRQVYRAADLPGKPRNAIGLLRDIPDAQMEALLMARGVVTAEAMRELALQRGLAVRDALIAKGLPSERLFVAAPRLRASGEEDAAWTPRVQLTLSTN